MALPQGSLCNIHHAIRRRTPGFEPSVFISVRDQACSSKHFAEIGSSIGGESRGPKGFKRERFVSEQEFHRATSFLQGVELPPRGRFRTSKHGRRTPCLLAAAKSMRIGFAFAFCAVRLIFCWK